MQEATTAHKWVGAVNLELNDPQAKRAVLRHSVWLSGEEQRLDVLEVYCANCRRPWDDVADEPCVAADTTEHLRGGPIGERKKRTHRHNCALLGCDTAKRQAVMAAG